MAQATMTRSQQLLLSSIAQIHRVSVSHNFFHVRFQPDFPVLMPAKNIEKFRELWRERERERGMLDSVLPRTDDFAAVQVRKRLAELGLTSARGEVSVLSLWVC